MCRCVYFQCKRNTIRLWLPFGGAILTGTNSSLDAHGKDEIITDEKLNHVIIVIDGLVMKPWHENNGAAIYVGRVTTVHNPLF